MSVRNIHVMLTSVGTGASGTIKAWIADQLRIFLAGMRDHRLYPAYHLSSHTGMRRGEIFG